MRVLLIIITFFIASAHSHEVHKIDSDNLYGKNIEGIRELKISKNGFSSSEADLDLSNPSQPALMDLDRGLESIRTKFYKSLPSGHYAAVYLDEYGNEVYWESLGNPFTLSASHQHTGGEIIYFNDEVTVNLKLYSDFKFSSIQVAYKDGNKINFYK